MINNKTITLLLILFGETFSFGAYAGVTYITCKDVAKHLKIYVQNPQNVGSSWRLYVRPRNSACLVSPSSYSKEGSINTMINSYIQPGTKNCEDSYKSYFTVSVPDLPYDEKSKWPSSATSRIWIEFLVFGKSQVEVYPVDINWRRMMKPNGHQDTNVEVSSACIR